MKKTAAAFFLVFAFSLLSYAETVNEVENPKTARNAWVSDGAEVMDSGSEAQINAYIDELEKKTGAEIAVVTVKKCETILSAGRYEMDVKDFAVNLFNSWGIGKKEQNNGVLVLVSIGQRRIEIETGYGVEGILPDGKVGAILDKQVIPYFKKDDYAGGIAQGVFALGNVIVNEVSPPPYLFLKKNVKDASAATQKTYYLFFVLLALSAASAFSLYRFRAVSVLLGPLVLFSALLPFFFGGTVSYLLVVLSVPPLLFSFFRLFQQTILNSVAAPPPVSSGESKVEAEIKAIKKIGKKKKADDKFQGFNRLLALTGWGYTLLFFTGGLFAVYKTFAYNPAFTDDAIANMIIGCLLFVPLYAADVMSFYHALEQFKRFVPVFCGKCRAKMKMLSGKEEEPHLKDWEILEQEIGSMDYCVWLCGACSSAEIASFKGAGFDTCPKCRHVTFERVKEEVVQDSTYSSTGIKEVAKKCRYKPCAHEATSRETIPRKVKTESSSYSSGGSSWGGGSSSSSGSFSGGSSGGGGAGRSW